MTESASATDVYKAVVEACGFNLQYLETNRKLELSPAQKQELQHEMRIVLIVLLLCGAGILSAVLVRSTLTYFLALLGGLIGIFMGYLYFKNQSALGEVGVIEGIVTSEEYVTSGRYPSHFYFYHVSDKKFGVTKGAYAALTQDIPIRAYFLVASEVLINLELITQLLPDGEEKPEAARPLADANGQV